MGGGASFALSSPAWFRLERRLSSSFLQGTRPRFASGTLMSLRTIPPFLAGVLCGCGRVFRTCASDNRAETLSASLLERAGAHLPALLQGNPPSRVLRFSLLRCGEHPRGYPDVASGGYSYPAPVNAAPPVVSRWRNMRSASQTLHGVRRRTPSPIASPPPAHSRLVFKSSSLKGKQRRAPERADKDAAIFHEEVPTYASTEHPTNPRRGSTPANPAA